MKDSVVPVGKVNDQTALSLIDFESLCEFGVVPHTLADSEARNLY